MSVLRTAAGVCNSCFCKLSGIFSMALPGCAEVGCECPSERCCCGQKNGEGNVIVRGGQTRLLGIFLVCFFALWFVAVLVRLNILLTGGHVGAA